FVRRTERSCLFINCDYERDHAIVSKLLALAHGLCLYLFKARLVNEGAANLSLVNNACALSVKFKNITVLNQDYVLFSVAEMILYKLLVTEEHPVLAVNRHNKFWAHGFRHNLYIFLRSVAADVNQAPLFFNDVCVALVYVA